MILWSTPLMYLWLIWVMVCDGGSCALVVYRRKFIIDLLWPVLRRCQPLQEAAHLHPGSHQLVQGQEEEWDASSHLLYCWKCLPWHVARYEARNVACTWLRLRKTIWGVGGGYIPSAGAVRISINKKPLRRYIVVWRCTILLCVVSYHLVLYHILVH